MISQIDETSWQGKYLNYFDRGKLKKGALTNKFELYSRHTGSLLGFVKWYAYWRKYGFVPLNCILDDGCLEEVAQFCRERTAKHRELHPVGGKPHVRKNFVQKILRFPKEL